SLPYEHLTGPTCRLDQFSFQQFSSCRRSGMTPNSRVEVGKAVFANDAPLALIAGPCQLESRQHAFDMAGRLKELTEKLGIGFVFKTSFDKANRTSLAGKRGAGLEAALPVFADLRKELGVPVLTDVHTEEQCGIVADVVDI